LRKEGNKGKRFHYGLRARGEGKEKFSRPRGEKEFAVQPSRKKYETCIKNESQTTEGGRVGKDVSEQTPEEKEGIRKEVLQTGKQSDSGRRRVNRGGKERRATRCHPNVRKR